MTVLGEDAGEARGGVVSADADGVGSEIQAVAALDGPDVVGVGTGHGEGHYLRPGGAGIERGVLEGVYIREFERGAAVDRRGAGVGIRHAKQHHAAGRSRRGDVEASCARDRASHIDQAAAADGVQRGGGAQGDTAAERQISGGHIAVVGILNRHAAGSADAADASATTAAASTTTAKTTRACATIAGAADAAAASACGTPDAASACGTPAAATAEGIRSHISGKAKDPGCDRCSIAAFAAGNGSTITTTSGTSRTTPSAI